jgi:hypothetical protein
MGTQTRATERAKLAWQQMLEFLALHVGPTAR